MTGERPLVQIFVRDNNVDQALKALKKKMQREGSFREMKRHVHYEKPSEKRARQQAEAVRRARKLARKRAQREGLIPAEEVPDLARPTTWGDALAPILDLTAVDDALLQQPPSVGADLLLGGAFCQALVPMCMRA